MRMVAKYAEYDVRCIGQYGGNGYDQPIDDRQGLGGGVRRLDDERIEMHSPTSGGKDRLGELL